MSGVRVAELVARAGDDLARRTDRLFVGLLIFQWLAAVTLAAWVAPLAWAGAAAGVHPHAWAAVGLGLLVISVPVWLGLARPGATITRHAIAAAQMLVGALLIHLTGGRVETHLHVLGSLALLAFYRDWRVLLTASAVTAADHLVRVLVWPESVYGAPAAAAWRWVGHAGWVVALDVFLVYSVVRGNRGVLVRAEREAALEAAEEKYRSSFNEAALGMAVLDPDGRFLNVNRTLCEMVGYTEAELLGMRFRDVTHPDDHAGDAEAVRRALADGERVYRREKRYLHKDGRVVWVQVVVSYVFDDAGRPAHVVSQILDITDRVRAAQRTTLLHTATRALAESRGVGDAVAGVLRAVCATTGWEDGEFWQATGDGGVGYAAGWPGSAPAGAGLAVRVWEAGEALSAPDPTHPARVGLGFPVVVGGRVVGVLTFLTGTPAPAPAQDDLELIEGLAGQIGQWVERRRAEDGLRESEERFRGAIEHAAIGMALVAPGGRFLRVNRALCDIVGYTSDELLARTYQEITHPEDVEDDVAQVGRVLAGESPTYQIEKRYVHKDGRAVWVLLSVSLVRDSAGNPLSFVSQIQDITERRRAAEERDRIFTQSLNLLAVVGFDGRFRRANPAWEATLGYPPEELAGRSFLRLTHPEDRGAAEVEVGRLAAGGTTREFETRWRHRGGSYRWVVWNATPFPDAAAFYATGQDVTDRKRAEEELLRTRGQLMDAIESVDAGFAMYDDRERLVVCNTRHKEMYPATAHLMTPGTQYEDVLRAAYRAGVAAAQGEDEWVRQRLAAHRHPGGPVERRIGDRWVRISDRLTRDGGLVSLRTDITALKRAQEEAEAANRAKSEFLANMSHEIRTPMNGVIGLTDLLLETPLAPEQRESLSLVKSSADALLTVINDILDFSKIEAGKLDLDPHRFRVRDAVGDTLKALALRAHGKGLELTCDIRPEVPEAVIGDAGRLRQVLTNLVGNAIKFTERGEVGVRAERVPDAGPGVRLRFTVTDTGIGIPADKLATVFDPFTQADGSTTRKYGGTGLGLTICARLVGLMGGRIAVESDPGRGSAFSFDVRFDPAAGSAAWSGEVPAADLRGVAVLVVDDNATNRRVLAETLQLWGARPVCTESGPDALTELRRAAAAGEPYPLVLLDAMMPGMDGFTVAGEIATRPDLAGPVVMLLSSADRQEDAARCRTLGLGAYLVKPVKPAELHRAISLSTRGGDGAGEPAARAPRPAAQARRLRILLAEDNPVNQRVAVRMLEGLGHSVTVAGDGGVAVEATSRERFDLVLMDVQMPRVDGFEATRQIRLREAGGPRTPVVAMTAHAMKGDRERCLAAGMDDYLSKPVHREELAAAIARATGPRAADVVTPPPADTPPPPPPVDRRAALDRLGGDEGLFAELAGLFLEEGPRLLGEIRNSLAAGDAVGVRQSAHGLKGSAGYVGGTRTASAAHRLELLGEAGDLAAAPAALRELEPELERLLAALAGPPG